MPETLWQRVVSKLRPLIVSALATVLAQTFMVLVLSKVREVPKLPPLASITFQLADPRQALQTVEATYGALDMIRFGPLRTVGCADCHAATGPAVPGFLRLSKVEGLTLDVRSCRALTLRPGPPAALDGDMSLAFDGGACPATVRLRNLQHRDASPELAAKLGAAVSAPLEQVDLELEQPSQFSLVFTADKRREIFKPMPSATALRLELPIDGEPWVVHTGAFHRCACQPGDGVDIQGPLTVSSLHVLGGRLHATVTLPKTPTVSCGAGGSSCGFNQELFNPIDVIAALIDAMTPGH